MQFNECSAANETNTEHSEFDMNNRITMKNLDEYSTVKCYEHLRVAVYPHERHNSLSSPVSNQTHATHSSHATQALALRAMRALREKIESVLSLRFLAQ